MPRLVANDIALALRKRIDAGEWTGNGRIPPERDLADEFGVARNTVRRAVGLLEESGTVVRQIGRGTFLAEANANTLAAAVTRMQGTSPADMMEIRQLLEPAAAAFAATNASVGELNAVREAYRGRDRSARHAEFRAMGRRVPPPHLRLLAQRIPEGDPQSDARRCAISRRGSR